MEHYVVIHAHFYQPPRENAWLEEIEIQDSAYPYHDWNERVNAECYAANAYSRILGRKGLVSRIVDNYKGIDFDFGPTLLSWMKEHASNIYEDIIKADQESVKEHSGHGNALAQAYNHLIMPLATKREKITQVIWGIEDFRSRFGRDPEGMWLPETAVDLETLEVLAQEGIKFTVLAPGQAHRIRAAGKQDWIHVDEGNLDVKRPYNVNLPNGKSIAVFFYNGPVSRAVAFEGLLKDGKNFADRLVSNFSKNDNSEIINIATDGESYGHHSKFGDMALAFCLQYIKENNLAKISNYGEYLAKNPPEWEAEIKENTSWSCVHGIERWKANCGCSTGGQPGWDQEWRAPLRQSVDWLNGELARSFEILAKKYFKDPWRARNGYINIILNRSPEIVDEFFRKEAVTKLSKEEIVQALKLLEMERNSMLMFTSCGWFFSDLSGIETIQVIQYAGRAIQLHNELTGESLEEGYLKILEKAKSNIPANGTGRDIYGRYAKKMEVSLKKVAVHFGISSLFEKYGPEEVLYCYDISNQDYEHHEFGGSELAAGKLHVRSRITWEEETVYFAALKLGNTDISCGICGCADGTEFETVKKDFRESFMQGAFSETIRLMDKYLGSHTYSLKDLFRDEQRKIINRSIAESMRDTGRVYRELYEKTRLLIGLLKEYGVPVPNVFMSTADYALHSELKDIIEDELFNIEKAKTLYAEMKKWDIKPNELELEFILRKKFQQLLLELARNPSSIDFIRHVQGLLKFAFMLPFTVNLWEAQNIYYRLAKGSYQDLSKQKGNNWKEWARAFKELGQTLYFDTEEVLRAG